MIECVDGLDEQNIHHMNAFYALIKKWLREKEYTSKLLTKEDYDAQMNFILRIKEGVIDCRDHYLTGNLMHTSGYESIMCLSMLTVRCWFFARPQRKVVQWM